MGKGLVFDCTHLTKPLPMCYRCWFGGQEQACRSHWHTPAYHTPLFSWADGFLLCLFWGHKIGRVYNEIEMAQNEPKQHL